MLQSDNNIDSGNDESRDHMSMVKLSDSFCHRNKKFMNDIKKICRYMANETNPRTKTRLTNEMICSLRKLIRVVYIDIVL